MLNNILRHKRNWKILKQAQVLKSSPQLGLRHVLDFFLAGAESLIRNDTRCAGVNIIKRSILMGNLFFLFVATVTTTNQVFAQQTWDVSVAPSTAYLRVAPGATDTHIITITNTGQTDLVIYPRVVDFAPDGKTGQPVLGDITSFPYLDTAPDQLPPLTIPINKKAQLSLVITPPSNAEEKEWPLVVLFQQNADNSGSSSMIDTGRSPSSSSQITGTIGSNLVVLVSSQTEQPYLLTTESINTPILVDSFRDVTVEAILKNNGLAATVASGSARLLNMFDKSIIDTPLYPDTVLGHSTRAARLAKTSTSPTSTHSTSGLELTTPPLQPQPIVVTDRVLLGPYQFIIELTNPLTGQSEIKTATILALPWSILAIILFSGICLILFKIVSRRYRSGL